MNELLQYHPVELVIAFSLLALLIVLTCLIISRLFDRALVNDVQEIEEGNRKALATFEEHASDLYDLKDSLDSVVEETTIREIKADEADASSETGEAERATSDNTK